jgi:hypothetical protein
MLRLPSMSGRIQSGTSPVSKLPVKYLNKININNSVSLCSLCIIDHEVNLSMRILIFNTSNG